MFDWDFIDHVYCISLRPNDTTRTELERHCNKVGLEVEFLIVDPHPDGGKAGCFDSHQQVARMALKAGYKNALILEDDARIMFDRMTDTRMKQLQRDIENVQYQIIYFGHMPMLFSRIDQIEQNATLARCTQSWMSHAYLASASFLKTIASEKYNNEHYDHFLHRVSDRSMRFVIAPMWLYQADDIGGTCSPTWILSSLCGIPRATQIAESMSIHYLTTYLVFFLFIVAVVGLIVFLLRRGHSSDTLSFESSIF